jgi:hypothetical protein
MKLLMALKNRQLPPMANSAKPTLRLNGTF